jgi:two-component system cell cycle response regulator CtrA
MIDWESGVMTYRDRRALLTRHEAVVLKTLSDRVPRVVTKEALLNELYSHRIDQADIKIVDVFVCRVRKKCGPLGLTIETIWGEGYRLTEALR